MTAWGYKTSNDVRIVNANTCRFGASLPFTHAYKKKELTRLFELKPTTLSKAEANKSRALFIVADLLWTREPSTTRCAIRCVFYSIGAFCCDLMSDAADYMGTGTCVRK